MIIIKKLLILGALGASALGVNAQKADAATVKRTVNHSQGVSVFTNYENAGYTGQLLRMGDQVDVYDTKTDLAGNKWIKIGEGQWIMEEYTAPSDSTDSTNSTYSSTSTSSTSSTYGQSSQGSTYGSTNSTSQSGSTSSTSQSGSTYKSTSQSSTYGSTNQSGSTSTYGSTSSTSQSGSTGSAYKSTTQSSTKTQNQQVSQSPQTSTQTQKPKAAAGLSSSESSAKEWIAQRESGGSYTAQNGQYYGRYQLSRSYLNGDYSSANQEKVANNYVKNRYGSWSNAKSFWQTHGWY